MSRNQYRAARSPQQPAERGGPHGFVDAFRPLNGIRSDRPIQERCPAADAGVVTGLDLTIAVLVVFAALAAPLLLGAGAVSLWRALRTS